MEARCVCKSKVYVKWAKEPVIIAFALYGGGG